MAQRATSLGPKPSIFYLFLFFLFFVFFVVFFLVFASARKNPVFPPKKGMFVYFFCVSLCFSLALFHFLLFLCLSLFFLLVSFLSVFSFLFLVLAFSFCFVYFRCSLVSVVLLVVLLCFES